MSSGEHESRRRVRTKEQQDRKRLVDRVKQKSNRHEAKTRLQAIQSGIENIQQTLELLSTQVQCAYPPVASSQAAASSSSDEYRSQPALSAYTATAFENPLLCVQNPSLAYHSQSALWSLDALLLQPNTSSQLAPFQCRCGIAHSKTNECMERQVYAILYERNVRQFQQPQLHPHLLPRNPPLPGWSDFENSSIESSLASILRGYNFKSTETLFGCYFFAYRLLRWRLRSDEESFADLPGWLVPTTTQYTAPHPVSIDFIPWPGIRDYLCLNQNQDYRQVSKIYVESLYLSCPKTCPVFGLGPCRRGSVSVSDEFAGVASRLENWSLGSPFIETFPHLVKYL